MSVCPSTRANSSFGLSKASGGFEAGRNERTFEPTSVAAGADSSGGAGVRPSTSRFSSSTSRRSRLQTFEPALDAAGADSSGGDDVRPSPSRFNSSTSRRSRPSSSRFFLPKNHLAPIAPMTEPTARVMISSANHPIRVAMTFWSCSILNGPAQGCTRWVGEEGKPIAKGRRHRASVLLKCSGDASRCVSGSLHERRLSEGARRAPVGTRPEPPRGFRPSV